ncbi:MAG: hypothetical protein WBR33_03255 [Pseudonocardiaceae bacterium]
MGTIIAVRQRPAKSLKIVEGVSALDIPRSATVKAVVLVVSDITNKAGLPEVPELVVTAWCQVMYAPPAFNQPRPGIG